MTPSGRSLQRGATLLEAMISLSVLLVATLGLYGAQAQAVGSDRRARAWTLADAVAVDLLEHLQRLPFAHPLLADSNTGNDGKTDFSLAHAGGDPVTGADAFTIDPDHTDAELGGWQGGTYPGYSQLADGAAGKPLGLDTLGDYKLHRYWNVQPQLDPLNPGIKQLAVIVTYNDGSGSRRAVVVHGTVFDGAAVAAAFAGSL